MVVVRLKALECIRTGTGELTEEPYLNIFVDESPSGDSRSMHPFRWGPFNMKTGDTRQIECGNRGLPDGHLCYEGSIIGIFLRERDAPGYLRVGSVARADDEVGGLRVVDPNVVVPKDHTVNVSGSRIQLDLPPISMASVSVRLA